MRDLKLVLDLQDGTKPQPKKIVYKGVRTTTLGELKFARKKSRKLRNALVIAEASARGAEVDKVRRGLLSSFLFCVELLQCLMKGPHR